MKLTWLTKLHRWWNTKSTDTEWHDVFVIWPRCIKGEWVCCHLVERYRNYDLLFGGHRWIFRLKESQ